MCLQPAFQRNHKNFIYGLVTYQKRVEFSLFLLDSYVDGLQKANTKCIFQVISIIKLSLSFKPRSYIINSNFTAGIEQTFINVLNFLVWRERRLVLYIFKFQFVKGEIRMPLFWEYLNNPQRNVIILLLSSKCIDIAYLYCIFCIIKLTDIQKS